MKVEMGIRWQVGPDRLEVLEPTVFRLLEAVERGRSLRAAAGEVGVSYRHAWGLAQRWEKSLGAPLLVLERGRGASLSALGQSLLWGRRRAHARLDPLLESLAAELEQELAGLLASASPVRVVASHDLAVAQLRDRLNALDADAGSQFHLEYRGSLDAVRQLAAGRCDLAGFHLPEPPLGQARIREIGAPFRRLLPPDRFRVLGFVHRQQGLMVAPGNPLGLSAPGDLQRNGVHFVNRQPGAGTRLLFDALLDDAGVEGPSISGYDSEEFTHLAVAAMVASAAADAGFGVQAAADRFGLDFVPLARERYLLAFDNAAGGSPWVRELGRALADPSLQRAISGLPGYDIAGMGEETDLAGPESSRA